jgi:hypothetical protein
MIAAFTRLLQDAGLRASLGEQAQKDVIQYSWQSRMQKILKHFSTEILEPKS